MAGGEGGGAASRSRKGWRARRRPSGGSRRRVHAGPVPPAVGKARAAASARALRGRPSREQQGMAVRSPKAVEEAGAAASARALCRQPRRQRRSRGAALAVQASRRCARRSGAPAGPRSSPHRQLPELHVKEGSVTRLACPDTSCRAPLPPHALRRLLAADEGLYARWESLALRVTLDTMPDVAYCPRCSAACVAAGDDAQCAACFFTFCARCRERRHLGLDCVPAEDKVEQLLLEVEEAASSSSASSSEEARRLEQRKVEELLSLREVLRTTRQCPSCRMAIAKTQGCNKMVCSNCGTFLCYRCGSAISGYAHFAGECGLFERVGRRRLDDDDFREPGWIRAIKYTCPTCGVKRPKTGKNNLLVCRACQIRYCALCWKRVWEVSHLYGPSGDCQQRS